MSAAEGPRSDGTVGGSVASARNVISGNDLSGIRIVSVDAVANEVLGNLVGTAADGLSALGNGTHGIRIDDQASGTLVGGSFATRNTVAHNGANGIYLPTAGWGNLISANRCFSNTGRAIDLGTNGPTPNDPGDPDTGPNMLQNYPVLSAVTRGSGTTIEGTLDSIPGQTFQIELFVSPPSSCWQASDFLGSAMVVTDAGGLAPFLVTVPIVVPAGSYINATATDAAGNTSEISTCATALNPPGTQGSRPSHGAENRHR